MTSNSKVAIVTGASKGYGNAVAKDLIAHGWRVVGNARSSETLDGAASEIGSTNFYPFAGDMNETQHLQALVDKARSLGPINLVVNNAGSLGPSPLPTLLELPSDEMAMIIQTNVIAPLKLIQLVIPFLDSSATVINMTSDVTTASYETWGAYSTSKCSLEQVTRTLASENPAHAFIALDPGDLQTDMHQAAFPGEDISDRLLPSVTAPAVRLVVEQKLESGRYRAEEIMAATKEAS